MMALSIPLGLLAIHFVGDFVLQTDWQAKNKSKNFIALLRHTCVYSLLFLPFGFVFALVTFITHTVTDAITSRLTAYFWAKQQSHNFFVVVGADQLVHFFTLALTYRLLR
jgi:hypothetical protein